MKKNQKGFTLMELMVVIVIVAILAAVAVPLYINYVKDAQLTEAKGAIGAIISAEQAYYQKSYLANAPKYADMDALEAQGLVDVREAKARWIFSATVVDNLEHPGYTILAKYIPEQTVTVQYEFIRPDNTGAGGTALFTP